MLLIIEILEIISVPAGALVTFVFFAIVMSKRNQIDYSLSTLLTINEKMSSYYKSTKVIMIVYGWIYSGYLLYSQYLYGFGDGRGILSWLLIIGMWIMIRFTITNPNLALIFFPLLSILKLSQFLFQLLNNPYYWFSGNLIATCIILVMGILLGIFGGLMWKIMNPYHTTTIKKDDGQKIESIQPIQPTKPVKIKFCQKCGASLLPNTDFCGECGAKIVR